MDGYLDEWVSGWMDGSIRIDKWVHGWVNFGCMDGQMGKWVGGWTDRQMDA